LTFQNAVKNKIALAIPDKANPSPSEQRRQELIAQAKEIQKKQGAGKDQRLSVKEKIQKKEEELRATLAELKAAQEKVPFRSVAEIDRKINELEAAVEKGTMKLVDERKALTEASNLRRLKKSFSKYADMQKKIDDLRAEIKELKASMDTAEAKALSEEYQRIQAELDALDKERKEASANLTALKKERDALRKQQQAAYAAIKAHKDAYYDQRRAWDRYIKEQKRKRAEREKAERERIARERRMERAQRMLAEASEPAYLEEIRRANNLLHYFDPSHPVVEKKALIQDKGLAAAPQRKVTEDDLVAKGMVRLARKEDRMEEYLPAKKTGKKGGNKKAAEAPSNKFSVPPSVVEDCAFIGVEPPMSAAEVPGVMEKIRAKLEQWKIDQPIQTQKVRFIFSICNFHTIANLFQRTSKRPRLRSPASRPRRTPLPPRRPLLTPRALLPAAARLLRSRRLLRRKRMLLLRRKRRPTVRRIRGRTLKVLQHGVLGLKRCRR